MLNGINQIRKTLSGLSFFHINNPDLSPLNGTFFPDQGLLLIQNSI